MESTVPCHPTAAKRCALLGKAMGVFARYGFRKASMDEIARAAHVSRQGLYLSFNSKEELFREALSYAMDQQLSAAIAALERRDLPFEWRLVTACDEWAGRFVDAFGSDALEVLCASSTLAVACLAEYERRFERALTGAISTSGLERRCATAGLCPADLARALHATARGLKHSCATREDFVKGMTAAARMFCWPLGQHR